MGEQEELEEPGQVKGCGAKPEQRDSSLSSGRGIVLVCIMARRCVCFPCRIFGVELRGAVLVVDTQVSQSHAVTWPHNHSPREARERPSDQQAKAQADRQTDRTQP